MSKYLLPAVILGVVVIIYFSYFAPSNELGSFSIFDPGSEINQEINVEIVKDKNFRRDGGGNIIGFFARDKAGVEKQISLHQPAPAGFQNAEIVELLGHFHGDNFTVSKLTIVE